jgi:hypothetical protein
MMFKGYSFAAWAKTTAHQSAALRGYVQAESKVVQKA